MGKFKMIDGVEQREIGRIGSTRIIETRSESRKSVLIRRPLRIVLKEREAYGENASMLADIAYEFNVYLGDEKIDRNFGFTIKDQTAELFAAVQEGRVEVELGRVIQIFPDPLWRQREDLLQRIGLQIKKLSNEEDE